jgi:hypothetical protein
MSAFYWNTGEPSIFLADGDAATRSRRASEAVDRKTAKTGRNPGSIAGISKADRAKNREPAWARKSGVR